MRKSKKGPALFELLRDDEARATQTLHVPRWWTNRPATRPEQPAPAETTAAEPPITNSDDEPPERLDRPERVVELESDRVRVSLTSVGAAGVVFLAVLLLIAAFAMGNRRGDRAGFRRGYDAGRAATTETPLTEVETVRSQSPATHVVGGLLTDRKAAAPTSAAADNANRSASKPAPSTPAAPSSAQPDWIRDYTYIVVQEFYPKHPEDAQRAQEFLAKRGIATSIVKLESGVLQLVTTQGYNRKDAAQKRLADQMLEKQRAIGAEYYAAGGGYKLEGYFKTLKRDTW